MSEYRSYEVMFSLVKVRVCWFVLRNIQRIEVVIVLRYSKVRIELLSALIEFQ